MRNPNDFCSSKYRDKVGKVQALLMNPPWNLSEGGKSASNRITFSKFKQSFSLPRDLMVDGLVFIWIEKELIFELIKFFETQNLNYVENVCYVMLDQTKKKQVDQTNDINIDAAIARQKSAYLKKSHKTLMIFRRVDNPKAKCNLELRHQRTCDVCFDWATLDEAY
jgi:hypothetical protein